MVENLYWSHLPDFYPLFIFICFSRFAVLNVEKLHWSYSLGFTPMCTIIWILRLAAWAVASLHWSHLLDFPPLCTFMWLFRFAVRDIKKIALITFIGLFSTVCPQANPIAKYHCYMYLLTSTLADYSLNEFPPQKNLLKPCTLCAYQGPANSKGKLHSFLQLIILQHGRRFPAHHRSKST